MIRRLPRDYAIFEQMEPGDEYPRALQIALENFARYRRQREAEGRPLEVGTAIWQAALKRFVPPYDPGKFTSKWWKMVPDAPSRTLMAHLGKDSYTHIHYEQPRTISVREAARLQSFPDGFVFDGGLNASFRQIGNAVPPLLALELARQIGETLGSVLERGAAQGAAEADVKRGRVG